MAFASRQQLTEWMLAARRGERSALRPLFDGLSGPVLALCRRLVGDEADAADAAQQTLEKLFAQVHRFDDDGDALAWAFTLAAWECRTVRRRHQRACDRHRPLDDDEPGGGSDPEDHALRRALHEAAALALGALSAEDRAALERALEPGPLDVKERKRKQRALTRLRRALAPGWE